MNTKPVSARGLLRLTMRLAQFLALLGLLAGAPQSAHASGPYVVDVTSDGHDFNLADGICDDGVGDCTLRAAIEQATHDAITTTISFSPTIAGQTILLAGTYGTINWTGNYITVDGLDGNITISGQNLNAGQSVIQISGVHNELDSVSIRDSKWDGIQIGDFAGVGMGNYNTLWNVAIYHSVAGGVYIHGSPSGGNDNSVQYSIIGAFHNSGSSCGSAIGNGYDGIYIDGGPDYTSISNNQIVCSGHNGIYIDGSGGTSVSTGIYLNTIGTDNGSSATLGNGWSGIYDDRNTSTQIANNTVSGNAQYGIWMHGSTEASITGNMIGTNNAGTAALHNQLEGLAITDNASHNTVGDPSDASLGNIISGNNGSGVGITSGANYNVLDGNYIGLGADGVTVIPNALAGVAFFNVPENALSRRSSTVSQYISGNTREGVYISNSDGIIINNSTVIGLGLFGNEAGNGLEGIKLDSGTTNAIISPGCIVYNGWTGVAVIGNTSVGNLLNPESVDANGGLPIDLGNDGPTDNGTQSPPGPDNWMNYPTISSGNGRNITGSATCAGCSVFIYEAMGDPRAAGGGGNLTLAVTTGPAGIFSVTIPASVPAITMVACNANNCSEMSPEYDVKYNIYLPLVKR